MNRPLKPLEFWGGVEGTVNRVHDGYMDQMQFSRHYNRLSDLDCLASLNISKLRYPVLWEHTAPESLDAPDWTWPDERLNRLRELNVDPIVGLVHHGSGPRYTSLIDPDFPNKLARYAGMVARRYPWVTYYTPVNEPLTTARFSGLYGHWYPHGRNPACFGRTLISQCKAVVLAMRAIRGVNPEAQLIQTEDLGKTHGTPRCQFEIDFQNERRWLSLDLLHGTLHPRAPMWEYLVRVAGVRPAELQWFRDNPCPPDVNGFNYYITSERFLDHRHHLYPEPAQACVVGFYHADVSAAHMLEEGAAGVGNLLIEAGRRFPGALAITEAHLGSNEEEQVRWLAESWRGVQKARSAGADVCALTFWCLLGNYYWNTLVTRTDGEYEPGAFDVRSGEPKETRVAQFIRQLASGVEPAAMGDLLLDTPGWWAREERFIFTQARATLLTQEDAPENAQRNVHAA